jgi:hypothetical protein
VKKLRINVAGVSCDELKIVAARSGFMFFEGKKHIKVKTVAGKFVTEIPRHRVLNKHTARAIMDAMISHGANIDY